MTFKTGDRVIANCLIGGEIVSKLVILLADSKMIIAVSVDEITRQQRLPTSGQQGIPGTPGAIWLTAETPQPTEVIEDYAPQFPSAPFADSPGWEAQ